MKTQQKIIAGFFTAFLIFGSLPLAFGENFNFYSSFLNARLSGLQEVPAVSTSASGWFTAKYDPMNSEVNWTLSIHNLEGEVYQAHLHFGKTKTNGGVIAWVCGNVDQPAPVPEGTQACLQTGTISGTITADDVVGPGPQGIEAGEFEEFVEALFSDSVYVNVHSSFVVSGEIRGQVRHRAKDYYQDGSDDYKE